MGGDQRGQHNIPLDDTSNNDTLSTTDNESNILNSKDSIVSVVVRNQPGLRIVVTSTKGIGARKVASFSDSQRIESVYCGFPCGEILEVTKKVSCISGNHGASFLQISDG